MNHETETHRNGVIKGLRAFAAFLETEPRLRIPTIPQINYSVIAATDDDERREIDQIAGLLGVTPVTVPGRSYSAERSFGGISYRAVAVTDAEMRRWRALMSYDHLVTPDEKGDRS